MPPHSTPSRYLWILFWNCVLMPPAGFGGLSTVARPVLISEPYLPNSQWHILTLRALDARLRGESYRTIAEVLLGFRGTKEDFESDPRKNKARRLVAHGIKMMRGGYRLLLHYPIKPDKR